MHWLYLLFALGALLLAITTTHAWLLALCLIAAAGLFVAWALALYQQRVGDSGRDALGMIDPTELRRMRELAEARRRADAGAAQPSTQSRERTPPPSA
ncbi:hypothetical protein B1992_05360 [Pseudoxanthomonas broegbernensis]|uniref:Uncharacterized protein n=1 Tax=Pseudoxanthomonas broegbernensis TaxID=83619 RepID=A0A7V8K7P1_9GAMM|nr:hypothetical protein [Pseudoxanthomonas broegbernensis]KAF1686823.1 hypothetical protein B1992_05360 [Pseudoxanthomonas broegbernensis]MBB6065592.1 HAMP domain-containing protein [Pseudoxanthomonas broegbernensis]